MPVSSRSSQELAAAVRGLRIRTTVALLVAAVALGVAFAGRSSGRVVVERLTLEDAEGRPRAVLDADDAQAPRLVLYDEEGRGRLQLGLAPGAGAGLVVLDDAGRPQLALGATDAGPQLSLFDRDGALRALLGAGTATDPGSGEAATLPISLSILDADGQPVWRAP